MTAIYISKHDIENVNQTLLLNISAEYTNLSVKYQITVLSSKVETKHFTYTIDIKHIYCFRMVWFYKFSQVQNTIKQIHRIKTSTTVQY